MLVFNPKRMFVIRGIDRPHSALMKAGISGGTATKILTYYNVRLTIEHVEKMCVLLNCTPNDLFEWHSDNKTALAENHSLNTIKREEKPAHISEIVRNLPMDKMAQVEKMLRDLENQE